MAASTISSPTMVRRIWFRWPKSRNVSAAKGVVRCTWIDEMKHRDRSVHVRAARYQCANGVDRANGLTDSSMGMRLKG